MCSLFCSLNCRIVKIKRRINNADPEVAKDKKEEDKPKTGGFNFSFLGSKNGEDSNKKEDGPDSKKNGNGTAP